MVFYSIGILYFFFFSSKCRRVGDQLFVCSSKQNMSTPYEHAILQFLESSSDLRKSFVDPNSVDSTEVCLSIILFVGILRERISLVLLCVIAQFLFLSSVHS